MGLKGHRKVKKITHDTVLLTDTSYPGGKTLKKNKLIRLDPERLTYYNIHLDGPTKDSLYFYQIVPDGDGESKLIYTGYEVTYPKTAPTKKQVEEATKAETLSWRTEWGNLAKAMEKDLRRAR